jgi:hypothetical protein
MVLEAYYLDNPSIKVSQQQLDNLGKSKTGVEFLFWF